MTATVNSTVVLIHIQFDAKNVFNAAQCRVQCVPLLVVKKKKKMDRGIIIIYTV